MLDYSKRIIIDPKHQKRTRENSFGVLVPKRSDNKVKRYTIVVETNLETNKLKNKRTSSTMSGGTDGSDYVRINATTLPVTRLI